MFDSLVPFYSCQKAGELMERRYDFPLNPIENARLRVHLRLCLSCQRYEEQSRLLQYFLDQYRSKKEWAEPGQKEIEEVQNRILGSL